MIEESSGLSEQSTQSTENSDPAKAAQLSKEADRTDQLRYAELLDAYEDGKISLDDIKALELKDGVEPRSKWAPGGEVWKTTMSALAMDARMDQPNPVTHQSEATEKGKVCPRCGFENRSIANYCGNCANPFQQKEEAAEKGKVCSRCGFQNRSIAIFCGMCGTPISKKESITQK